MLQSCRKLQTKFRTGFLQYHTESNLTFVTWDPENQGHDHKTTMHPNGPMGKLNTKFQIDICVTF